MKKILTTRKKFLSCFMALIIIITSIIVSAPKLKKAFADEIIPANCSGCNEIIDFYNAFPLGALSQFLQVYHALYPDADDAITHRAIDYYTRIHIVEEDTCAVLFDLLSTEGGHVIIGHDFVVYEMQALTDFPAFNPSTYTDVVHYSYLDGFVYLDYKGVYQKYTEDNAALMLGSPAPANPQPYNLNGANMRSSNPPDDGEIHETGLYDYLTANYLHLRGEDNLFTPKLSESISVQIKTQYSLSHFIKWPTNNVGSLIINDPDNEPMSEGNCTQAAMYNLIWNWTAMSLIDMPYKAIGFGNSKLPYQLFDYGTSNLPLHNAYDITTDYFYNIYAQNKYYRESDNVAMGNVQNDASAGGENMQYYTWKINQEETDTGAIDYKYRTIPIIYDEIRKFSTVNYDYNIATGMNSDYVDEIMEYIVNARFSNSSFNGIEYNNSIDVVQTSAVCSAIESVKKGIPAYLAIRGSNTYGNHAVVLTGYYDYETLTEIDVSLSNNYKLSTHTILYRIIDGHFNRDMLFDPQIANPNYKVAVLASY